MGEGAAGLGHARSGLIVGPELFINVRKGPFKALRLPQIVNNSAGRGSVAGEELAWIRWQERFRLPRFLGTRLVRTLGLIFDDQAQTFGQSGALGSTNTQLLRLERR